VARLETTGLTRTFEPVARPQSLRWPTRFITSACRTEAAKMSAKLLSMMRQMSGFLAESRLRELAAAIQLFSPGFTDMKRGHSKSQTCNCAKQSSTLNARLELLEAKLEALSTVVEALIDKHPIKRSRSRKSKHQRPILIELQSNLSPRESDVLRHFAELRSDKRVASKLGIQLQTVRNHMASIKRKLQVDAREDLLAAIFDANPQTS
jgi:DNA-binding CsgD family transcriptional regulator